jgi:6-phosphogluconolactonase
MAVTPGRPEIVAGDAGVLELAVAAEFTARSAAAIHERGSFSVALPGGSVAFAFFPSLAKLPLDWAHIDIFWIDERAVRPDHPDSNYGLASRLLLQPAGVASSRVHRIHGDLPDIDAAARRASNELLTIAGNPPRLDLALVGFGDDGHVASIFAERAGLQPGPQPIIAIHDAPKPPPRRLTMTFPVLAGAHRVIVAGFGPAKAQVLHDALNAKSPATPVAELLRRASSSIVLVDHRQSH